MWRLHKLYFVNTAELWMWECEYIQHVIFPCFLFELGSWKKLPFHWESIGVQCWILWVQDDWICSRKAGYCKLCGLYQFILFAFPLSHQLFVIHQNYNFLWQMNQRRYILTALSCILQTSPEVSSTRYDELVSTNHSVPRRTVDPCKIFTGMALFWAWILLIPGSIAAFLFCCKNMFLVKLSSETEIVGVLMTHSDCFRHRFRNRDRRQISARSPGNCHDPSIFGSLSDNESMFT